MISSLLLGTMLLGASPSGTPDRLLHVRVAMRDGVRLDTNIFKPAGSARYPAILVRTPYDKGPDLPTGYMSFINRGYAVVLQDVRGRYASEGVFEPLNQEGPDGNDTLNWIASQPWSDGKVGMIGGSYLGMAQWQVALWNNPHLKAIFPVVAGSDDYLDRFYSPGGAMRLGHRLLWLSENLTPPGASKPKFEDYVNHLPLRTSDRAATRETLFLYQTIVNHPSYDPFWKAHSTLEKMQRVHVPVFAVDGWYDGYAEDDLRAFSTLHKLAGVGDDRHRILIGPWPHNMSIPFQGINFGDDSSSPIRSFQLAWFDRWLKGAPPEASRYLPRNWHQVRAEVDTAPVHIFVMGANRWRDEQEWPLERTRYTALYLSGHGEANTATGDGTLQWNAPHATRTDTFTYDPHNPVPTHGGAVCCNPKIFPWGPMDQRAVESRRDVLVYTSAALKQDLEVTGPVSVVLYASTSAPDTDFTAKLVDVFPNGEARNLTDGILRVRYRHGLENAELAKPDEVYTLTIDAGVTSNVFLAGHAIRVEISSSNFPRFDRNPNTGRAVADETTLKTAKQTLAHGPAYPSHVLLPVIPASESESARASAAQLTSASGPRYGARGSSARASNGPAR